MDMCEYVSLALGDSRACAASPHHPLPLSLMPTQSAFERDEDAREITKRHKFSKSTL